jgi:glycine C-acetyltransferase
MLRLIPTAAHTLEDVKYTIDAFEAVKQKLEHGDYSSGIAPSVADKY